MSARTDQTPVITGASLPHQKRTGVSSPRVFLALSPGWTCMLWVWRPGFPVGAPWMIAGTRPARCHNLFGADGRSPPREGRTWRVPARSQRRGAGRCRHASEAALAAHPWRARSLSTALLWPYPVWPGGSLCQQHATDFSRRDPQSTCSGQWGEHLHAISGYVPSGRAAAGSGCVFRMGNAGCSLVGARAGRCSMKRKESKG
jgi:hypothetical protein